MTHVSIVVPQGGALLNSIVRLFKIFNWANCYLTEKGSELLFDVHLVGITTHVDLYGGLFSVKPDLTLADASETDLVIIPALAGNIAEELKNNTAFIPWIKEQYQTGAEIAGLCTGAFLLAGTGLIDDQECTTHWFVAAEFRKEFSQINLVAEKIIIDEQAIYTNGGAYSFISLLLKKLAGREVAIAGSNIFEIEFNQECQSVVTILNGQKEQEDGVIKKPRQYIENHLRGKITMEQFAEMFTINRTKLKGSIKIANANTFKEYMQNVKVEAAGKSLEAGCGKVNEGSEVGYNNSKTFKEIFKKITRL